MNSKGANRAPACCLRPYLVVAWIALNPGSCFRGAALRPSRLFVGANNQFALLRERFCRRGELSARLVARPLCGNVESVEIACRSSYIILTFSSFRDIVFLYLFKANCWSRLALFFSLLTIEEGNTIPKIFDNIEENLLPAL